MQGSGEHIFGFNHIICNS